MRFIQLLFVIGLTFPVVVQAQTGRTMADATHALKGPVHTVRSESATYVLKDGQYVEGPRLLEMTATFDENGARTELCIYHNGVLRRRIEMKFVNRKMTEFANYDGDGKMWLRGTNVYDDDGQLKEQLTYNGDGSLRSKRSSIRNKQGQLIESAEHSANGILMEKTSNTYVDGVLTTSKRSLHYPDGSVRTIEAYEMAKKRLETINYAPDGSLTTRSVRVDREIREYARDGSLLKTTTISTEGRLLDEVMVGADGPSRREGQLPDQIDAHGNWTVLTKWQADANGQRPLKTTYRTITYYTKFVF